MNTSEKIQKSNDGNINGQKSITSGWVHHKLLKTSGAAAFFILAWCNQESGENVGAINDVQWWEIDQPGIITTQCTQEQVNNILSSIEWIEDGNEEIILGEDLPVKFSDKYSAAIVSDEDTYNCFIQRQNVIINFKSEEDSVNQILGDLHLENGWNYFFSIENVPIFDELQRSLDINFLSMNIKVVQGEEEVLEDIEPLNNPNNEFSMTLLDSWDWRVTYSLEDLQSEWREFEKKLLEISPNADIVIQSLEIDGNVSSWNSLIAIVEDF